MKKKKQSCPSLLFINWLRKQRSLSTWISGLSTLKIQSWVLPQYPKSVLNSFKWDPVHYSHPSLASLRVLYCWFQVSLIFLLHAYAVIQTSIKMETAFVAPQCQQHCMCLPPFWFPICPPSTTVMPVHFCSCCNHLSHWLFLDAISFVLDESASAAVELCKLGVLPWLLI